MPKSPQLEDGYTTIANELIDALAKLNLSAYETRVLMAILRKTYGWHKKQDRISYSQFEELTRLNRWHVERSIKKLVSRSIITLRGNGHKLYYGIQKDYSRWDYGIGKQHNPSFVSLPNEVTNDESLPYQAKPLPKEATNSLPNKVTTKERKQYTKAKRAIKKQTFDDYEKELRSRYTDINFDHELEKFWLYWSEGSRKLNNPKLALLHWMDKARRDKTKEASRGTEKDRGHRRNIGDRTRYNKENY